MTKNLITFHFDPEKSGKILNGWAKEAGVSIKTLGDDTGYTYDTTNNSLHGKIKDLSLERVFKFAVRTGHSVCEYIRIMLKDEDIDFADQIHVLRDADMVLAPYKEEGKKPCTDIVQNPENLKNDPVFQALSHAVMQEARDTHQANLDRFKAIYEKALEDQRVASQQELKKRDETYDRSVNYLKSQVEEMRKDRRELQAALDLQKARADNLDRKRHNVFWGMLAVIILLLILMSAMMIVDAPGIGMGWG